MSLLKPERGHKQLAAKMGVNVQQAPGAVNRRLAPAVNGVPLVRFEFVGIGPCLDVKKNYYDFVADSAVADLDACKSLCGRTAHGGSLVGLAVVEADSHCECYFSDGFLEDDGCNSIYFDMKDMDKDIDFQDCYSRYTGIGKVDNSDDTDGYSCYRVSEDIVSV